MILVCSEELTRKVEHLLDRALTKEERKFLVLACGSLESNGEPPSEAQVGAA
jgi:hypothetical protein